MRYALLTALLLLGGCDLFDTLCTTVGEMEGESWYSDDLGDLAEGYDDDTIVCSVTDDDGCTRITIDGEERNLFVGDNAEECLEAALAEDTGSSDTGSTDTGSTDTASTDTGSTDTSTEDTDTGSTDTDDTGSEDTADTGDTGSSSATSCINPDDTSWLVTDGATVGLVYSAFDWDDGSSSIPYSDIDTDDVVVTGDGIGDSDWDYDTDYLVSYDATTDAMNFTFEDGEYRITWRTSSDWAYYHDLCDGSEPHDFCHENNGSDEGFGYSLKFVVEDGCAMPSTTS